MQHMQGVLKPQSLNHHERIVTPQPPSSHPSSSSSPRPKRPKYSTSTGKKRFAPKTRTGCLTCRARRVKCTEERPACGRCVKGDYKCKYATDQTKYFPATDYQGKKIQANVRSSTESSYDSSDDSADNRLVSPLQPNYGTPEESHYLNRFLDFSAPWFSSYIDPSFFFKLLPQRSWHNPALKHSLVALAMASERARLSFQPSEFAHSHEKHQARHHWHYAQALQEVYKARDINEDVVLLASAVFWLHDNITKNSRTAMVHLQGFLRILTERKLRRQKLRWQEDEWESTILRGLVFSADVADEAFAETLEPNLMQNIRSRLNDPKYSRSFKKMSSVRDELRLGLTAIPYSSLSGTPNSPSSDAPVTTAELRTYFERWYRAFSTLPDLGPVDKILLECHYVCVALSLQVHESGQKVPKVDDPQSVHRMEYILSMLEQIDLKKMIQPPLGKDVEMPIIPILTQVIVLSSSGSIRSRAFKMLKVLNRVEGLWASDVVADMMAIAYPLEGGSGPWSRKHPVKSRIQPVMETDGTMMMQRDDDKLATRELRKQHESGVIHLDEPYGRVHLYAPKDTGQVQRELSTLHGQNAGKDSVPAEKRSEDNSRSDKTAARGYSDFLSTLGQEAEVGVTHDSTTWIDETHQFSADCRKPVGQTFEKATDSTVDDAKRRVESVVEHRERDHELWNAGIRFHSDYGNYLKDEHILDAGKNDDGQDSNTAVRYVVGGDYSYANRSAPAIAIEVPTRPTERSDEPTRKRTRADSKTVTSASTLPQTDEIQNSQSSISGPGESELHGAPSSLDKEERELMYGMGGAGFNLHVR